MALRRSEVDEFVKRVREAGLQPPDRRPAEPLCRYLDQVIEAGNWQLLDDICHGLYALGGLTDPYQHRLLSSVLHHLERRLAYTRGKDYALFLARLSLYPEPDPGARQRHGAMRADRIATDLVCGQDEAVLQELMQELQHDDRYDDLLVRMAHEAVVRRKMVSFPARVRLPSVRVSPKGRMPLLGWYAYTLPRLELHPIEAAIDAGDRDFNGSGLPGPCWTWEAAEHDPTNVIWPCVEGPPAVRKISRPNDRRLIESVVESWTEASNGMAESGVFQAAADVGDEAVPSILLSLGLDCLVGVDFTGLAVRRAAPREIFGNLFYVACSGGAYGEFNSGAIARFKAWQSLAGLTGTYHQNGSGEEIEEVAERCAWYLFCSNGDWFGKVAWDLGIVCVRPERKTFAILVATDRD